MTVETYDLVVIGAGNAGQAAAGALRAAGKTVAIVESYQVGGVCPNRGCTPKKVLVAAAEALDTIRRASGHAISVADVKLDWRALIERKRGIVGPLPDAMSKSLEDRGIVLVRGAAKFVAGGSVEVGDRTLRAPKYVLATGSRPRPLTFEGAELAGTSDDFLELERQPGSILFVGAGVIAMEFAHVLARAGSRAIVVARGDRPLGNFDADAVAALVEYSRTLGIAIKTTTRVVRLARAGDRLVVELDEAGTRTTVEVDGVINGSGRIANVDRLGLEHLGITVRGNTVAVDPELRCIDNPDVSLAGDVLADTPQLSPIATKEGRLVGHNLLNPSDTRAIDHRFVPQAVFTIPTLARVGLTAVEATARGLVFEARQTDMREWISSRTYREEAAYAKVLIDSHGKILGADLLGHGAGDTIHLFALAIRYGIPASELRTVDYAYPTPSNDVKFLF
ncbi:MAG: NAD(P)/FAD-dependent oxidoreductase [Kofleriaceae bacterium]